MSRKRYTFEHWQIVAVYLMIYDILAVCRLQRAAAGNVSNGFNRNVLHTGSDDF